MNEKKDFSKEILAYALKNAIEHGVTNAGRILPKLFRHGLEKKDIEKIMPLVNSEANKVNAMLGVERIEMFEKYKKYVVEREESERELPELKNAVKGKVVMRVAPYPSGALHIGNAKTYLLNAIYSERYGGEIILVMDDTIGSEEKPIHKDAYSLIEDALKWLGIKHDGKIVYKSDRLEIYYRYAEKLIKKDRVYVCHCSAKKLRENREKSIECSCRHFPVKIQIERWKDMFKADVGDAVLRIKTDMMHKNPAFRDRVLFRISDREHARVGKKYRVWPTLEMSWAIDDHLLGITHILRGNDLMMESEMEKYIWDIFGWKHPEIIHTGLVKIDVSGAKISKSKAQKEVLSGELEGWDDPRTWSVQSLRKRGIGAEAIRKFIEEIGLSKQDTTVPIETLYSINRSMVDAFAERYSFVANPVCIEVENAPDVGFVEVPVHPDQPKKTRKIIVDEIFISGDDYKKFKGREVRLLHLYNINLDKSGKKAKLSSIAVKDIPKIQWVSHNVPCEVVMDDGSRVGGFAESSIDKLKVGNIVQFERFGFVRYDGERGGVHVFYFAHK